MNEIQTRHWWQFSVGTLLTLMLVSGLAVGWWCDRSALAERDRQLQRELDDTQSELDRVARKLAVTTNFAVKQSRFIDYYNEFLAPQLDAASTVDR